jgi:hypothetical protein
MDIEQLTEDFNLEDPEYQNCFGMYWLSEENAFFIPEYSFTSLYSAQVARDFLREKGLGGKKLEKEILSKVNMFLARVRKNRSVKHFVPRSGWLSAGEHHLDGYDSFLVGEGFTKPEIADIPCPTFDAQEKAVGNPKERRYFRALMSGVLKGLLSETPVVSPVLVLAGGSNNKVKLRNLTVTLFGGGLEYSSVKSPETAWMASSILWYADEAFGFKNGEINFRNLRKWATQEKLNITHEKRRYNIPAFSFIVMLSQLIDSSLSALPHPGASGIIVLSCDREVKLPELNLAERPGYFHSLLQEESKFPDEYFSLDIQESKFRKLEEKAIYDFLKGNCQAPIIKPSGELRADLSESTKDAQHCLIHRRLDDILGTLARYRPKEIRQLGNGDWQLDFTN